MCIPIHPAVVPEDPDAALALYRMTRGLAASNDAGPGALRRPPAKPGGQSTAPNVPNAIDDFRSDQ